MNRFHHGWCLLLVAACGRPTTMFEPSPTDDARSVIFVAVYPDHAEAHAIDLEAETANAVLTPADADLELYALNLDRTLTELRLEPGRLPLATSGGRAWPDATKLFRSTYVEGTQSPWAPLTALPDNVGNLRINLEPVDACDVVPVGFDIVSRSLDTKADVSWGAQVDEATAIISTADRRQYLVTADDFRPANLTQPPGVGAAYQMADLTIWVVGHRGTWRGKAPLLEFERVAEGIADLYSLGIAGPTDPTAPLEIYVIGERGQVHRFDGVDWTDVGLAQPTSNADLIWIGPGEVIVARESVTWLERIRDGVSEQIAPLQGTMLGLTAVKPIPPYDLVVGTRDGHVYSLQDGDWKSLGHPLLDRIFDLRQDGEELIVAGVGGRMARYSPGFGFCNEELAPSHLHQLLPFADGYLGIMANRDTWDIGTGGEPRYFTPLSWLSRR